MLCFYQYCFGGPNKPLDSLCRNRFHLNWRINYLVFFVSTRKQAASVVFYICLDQSLHFIELIIILQELLHFCAYWPVLITPIIPLWATPNLHDDPLSYTPCQTVGPFLLAWLVGRFIFTCSIVSRYVNFVPKLPSCFVNILGIVSGFGPRIKKFGS